MDAVVHLAGIAHIGTDISDETYDRVNHLATAALARAAATAAIKRFVFISSIRAQSGTHADHPLTRERPAAADRSLWPLQARRRRRPCARPACRTRSCVRCWSTGAARRATWRSLLRLARLPLPLPFGRLANKRSLLGVDNLIAAVRFALENERAANETFIVADPQPVSVADIVAISRAATGRKPNCYPVPPGLFARLFAARRPAGEMGAARGLARSAARQNCSPPAGSPSRTRRSGLTALLQAASPPKSGTASRSTP